MDDPVFDSVGRRIFEPGCGRHCLQHCWLVFGVNHRDRLQVVRPFLGRAEDGPVPGIGRRCTGHRVDMPRAEFGGVKGQLPSFLARPQQFTSLLLIGYVPKVHGKALRRGVGSELVPAVEVRIVSRERFADPASDDPAIHLLELAADCAGKLVPQDLADQIAGRAVQEALARRIDVGDAPVAVKGEKAVGDAFQNGSATVFARSQRVFAGLAVANVVEQNGDLSTPVAAETKRVDVEPSVLHRLRLVHETDRFAGDSHPPVDLAPGGV